MNFFTGYWEQMNPHFSRKMGEMGHPRLRPVSRGVSIAALEALRNREAHSTKSLQGTLPMIRLRLCSCG